MAKRKSKISDNTNDASKKSIFTYLSESNPVADTTEWLSTGMPLLDKLLSRGKGIPYGKIIEIYGKEATGKTAFCHYLISRVQKEGGYGIYIDFESSFDSEQLDGYGIDKARVLYSAPETIEEAFKGIFQILDESKKYSPFVIVIDSVAAMVADAEKEDGDKAQVAIIPRILSRTLRKLVVRLAGKKGFVIFTNQVRDKIGVMFGDKTSRPGGHALDFYASVILQAYVKETLTKTVNSKKVSDAFVVSLTNKKNRKGIPKESTEIILSFDNGINLPLTMLNSLLDEKLVQKRGKFFVFDKVEYTREKFLAKIEETPDVFYKLFNNI